jgi:inorganic pyrophosphatase
MPGQTKNTEITHTYGHDEAIEVIKQSITDYQARFDNLGKLMY